MCNFTRREILKILSLSIPATLLRCSKKDLLEGERVCIHIFNKNIEIPKPLLKQYNNTPNRPENSKFFQIGVPELLLCTSPISLINIFQYVWPISQDEFKRFHGSISIRFKKYEIAGRKDIDDFVNDYKDEMGWKDDI